MSRVPGRSCLSSGCHLHHPASWDPPTAVPGRPPLAGHPALQLLPGAPRGGSVLGAPAPGPPGDAGAGRGAGMAGGQLAGGLSEQIAGPSSQRDGTLFLAARSPGVLSFTRLFTPGSGDGEGQLVPGEPSAWGAPSWTPLPGGSGRGTRPAPAAPAQPAAPGPSQIHPLGTPPSRPGPLPAGTGSCRCSRPHTYRAVGELPSGDPHVPVTPMSR